MSVSPDTTFQLVHVGKCGGSSVAAELRQRGFQFDHVHMRRPVARPDGRYVILVRDPVARLVSAFNWRRHLLANDLLPAEWRQDPVARLAQQAELSFLAHFRDVNDYAEQFVRNEAYDVSHMATMTMLITHAPQGFRWYLDDLLDRMEPAQLLGVIAMERLADDVERVFGFRPVAERNRHSNASRTDLSPLGRANLVRELAPEYQTLARLAAVASRAGVPMSVAYEAV